MSNKFNKPKMVIKYNIYDEVGTRYHTGTFNFDDDQERRAFAERVEDCYLARHRVETFRVA